MTRARIPTRPVHRGNPIASNAARVVSSANLYQNWKNVAAQSFLLRRLHSGRLAPDPQADAEPGFALRLRSAAHGSASIALNYLIRWRPRPSLRHPRFAGVGQIARPARTFAADWCSSTSAAWAGPNMSRPNNWARGWVWTYRRRENGDPGGLRSCLCDLAATGAGHSGRRRLPRQQFPG